jgi:hypothetical protein
MTFGETSDNPMSIITASDCCVFGRIVKTLILRMKSGVGKSMQPRKRFKFSLRISRCIRTALRTDDESGEDTDAEAEADAETRIFTGTTGDAADDEDNGQDSE